VADLTGRATKALDDGNDAMATEGANAIAQLENELEVRRQTLDLKQGAINAKAVRYEQSVQAKMNTTLQGQSSVAEAEELIANALIMMVNLAGVFIAYGMLALSLYMSPDVPLSTKGYWGIGILMLSLSLVNYVKCRFDERISEDRIQQIERAQNEKLLEDFVTVDKFA